MTVAEVDKLQMVKSSKVRIHGLNMEELQRRGYVEIAKFIRSEDIERYKNHIEIISASLKRSEKLINRLSIERVKLSKRLRLKDREINAKRALRRNKDRMDIGYNNEVEKRLNEKEKLNNIKIELTQTINSM